jgi:signal transduction histidine kinase
MNERYASVFRQRSCHRAGLVAILIGALFMQGQVVAQNLLLDSIAKKMNTLQGSEKAFALHELVYGYLRVDREKAERYNEQAKKWLRTETDPGVKAYLGLARGVYCGRSGKLDSGVYFLNEAKKNAIEANLSHALIRIYAGLGHTYISSGKPKIALENMFEGLRALNNQPDAEMEYKLRTNIAWAYLELKQYRNCITHGLTNIRLMEGTEFEWIALYSYNNIAVSYGALGLLDSAKFFIEKGIRAAMKSNDIQSLANGYFILGTIYSNAGKFDLAVAQYEKARPYRERVGNPLFLVSDLYTMSELYFKIKEFSKGIAAGTEALRLAEQYNLQLKLGETYLSLAQNYEGLHDFKNSSKYYRLWSMAKDTVYTNANSEAIAEMETRFETEKKEQQLALQRAELSEQKADLQRTYVIIGALGVTLVLVVIIFLLLRSRLSRERAAFLREAQIQATIQSQESERRRFAQDLHDGMGQLISALRLAIHSIHRNSSLEDRVVVVTKAENLLNDMHMEIRSIAFNLMPQTLVQNGIVPALKEMSVRVNDSANVNVRVSSFDMPERLSELQEISIYRIIQEWINNVIKYAEASIVEVQLVGYEDEVSVILEDNGKGFDIARLENSAGNGWKNMRSRISLVRGFIEIDSRPGRIGTTVMLRIPVQLRRSAAESTVSTNTH